TILRGGIQHGYAGGDERTSGEDFIRKRLARHRAPTGPIERAHTDGSTLLINEALTGDGGVVQILTDVTSLKRQEEELRRQSLLLQTTLDSIDQGLLVCDKEQRIVASNRRFHELRGIPESFTRAGGRVEDFLRYSVLQGEYGPVEDVEAAVAERMALVQGTASHYFERTRPNGVTLEIVIHPMPDGGAVTIYTDITEVHEAREALHRSREHL